MLLNKFHKANVARQHEAFAPAHSLIELAACVQEEAGELAGAVLGVTGAKKRKSHKTREDVLDAVADCMTYLSLVAAAVGCEDLEGLLVNTFNMVSDRAGSAIKVSHPTGADARKILSDGLKYHEFDGHDMPKAVARDALEALGVPREEQP